MQAVDRFVIGRRDAGEVAFIGLVDVRGLVLDEIIDIEKGRIQIYGLPGGAHRPAVGQGLNQPALLTFRYAYLSTLKGRTSLLISFVEALWCESALLFRSKTFAVSNLFDSIWSHGPMPGRHAVSKTCHRMLMHHSMISVDGSHPRAVRSCDASAMQKDGGQTAGCSKCGKVPGKAAGSCQEDGRHFCTLQCPGWCVDAEG